MANESIPFYEDADELPCYCKAAVTGKRFVQIAGNKQGTLLTAASNPPTAGLEAGATGGNYTVGLPNCSGAAGAGAICLGVAAFDQVLGGIVTVHRVGIFPVTCAANLNAGAEVEVNATGQVIPLASGKAVGMCMTGALSGADAEILLYQAGH